MTRTEYLRELERYLKKLPRADYEEAMAYFEEYFDEAGEENAQQVMEDLGTPKEAANDLIKNLLNNSATSPIKPRQRKFSEKAIIAILALLSAPVTIPFVFAILGTLFAMIVTIIALLFAGLVLSLTGFILGAVFLVDAFHFLSYGSAFLMGLGGALAAIGGSILLFIIIIALTKIFFQLIIALVKWIIRKVHRHEK